MEEEMTRRTARILTIISVFALGACDSVPTAPTGPDVPSAVLPAAPNAQVWRSTEVHVSEIWGTYWQFECDDGYESEFIRLEGVVRHRMTLMDDGAGGFHFRFQSNATGARGIGEDSGAEFRVVDSDNEVYHDAGGTITGTLRSTRRLIATGSGRGFTMVWSAQFTLRDGTLLVDREETRFECGR
jgi:hypothetical protein